MSQAALMESMERITKQLGETISAMSKLYNLELRDRDNELALLRKRVEILEMERADARVSAQASLNSAAASGKHPLTSLPASAPMPKTSLLPKLADYPLVQKYADIVRTVLYEHKSASERVKWFDTCVDSLVRHNGGGVAGVVKGNLYRHFDRVMGAHQAEIGYYTGATLPKKGGRAFRILGIDELASVLVACVCDKVTENLDKAG